MKLSKKKVAATIILIIVAALFLCGFRIFSSLKNQRVLLIFQTNSELRSLGGMVGGVAVLNIDGTKIELENYHSNSEFLVDFDIDATEEEANFNKDIITKFVSNSTQSFSFSRASNLVKQHYQRQFPEEYQSGFDSTIMFDPIFLGQLQKINGEQIIVNGHSLGGQDLTNYLLDGIYLETQIDDEQNKCFNEIAKQLFSHVASDFKHINISKISQYLDLLKNSENISIESNNQIFKSYNHYYFPKDHEIATYFNEYTSSKLDYFASYNFQTKGSENGICNFEIEVENRLKESEVDSKNWRLFGDREFSPDKNIYPSGWLYQSVVFALPENAKIIKVETDGAPSERGVYSSENQRNLKVNGRDAINQAFVVPPEGKVTIKLTVQTENELKLIHPPLLNSSSN